MSHGEGIRGIRGVGEAFAGYQQGAAHHYRVSADDVGVPVTRILPRALMMPPGIPDFMSRVRFSAPTTQLLTGRAWSGYAPITTVEVSADGGLSWTEATLGDTISPYPWRSWSHVCDATKPGEYEMCVRSTDCAGNGQPR